MAKQEQAEGTGQERQVGQMRANTDANLWVQLAGAALLTAAVSFGLYYGNKMHPQGLLKYVNGLVNERGPVQWFEVFSFFMTLFFVVLKFKIVRNENRHVYLDTAKLTTVNMDSPDELQMLRKRIHDEGLDLKSVLLGRLDRGLALWLATKDIGRVSTWISNENSRDVGMSDLTYTLARTNIWAIPIFGFIGTVQGLSSAVGGFAEFLQGEAELAAIKGAIANVTIGLGVAFDTTFLALMLVTVLQFPISSVGRREATLLGEIDVYLDEHFISRLPSPEQQSVVIENLEDSIEAAFRRYIPDPDRYEEVFTESIEKAGIVVAQQFESFTENYVESRKKATDAEVKSLAEALESAHMKAAELARQYAHSADGIQAALGDSLHKAAAAASDVAKQVDTIADLGEKIKELLQIEQALERSMAGIAGAEGFQKTFEQLREHLATTDEFCRRLSKPKVITLREEVAS